MQRLLQNLIIGYGLVGGGGFWDFCFTCPFVGS